MFFILLFYCLYLNNGIFYILCFFFPSVSKLNKDLCTKVFLPFFLALLCFRNKWWGSKEAARSRISRRNVSKLQHCSSFLSNFQLPASILLYYQNVEHEERRQYILLVMIIWCFGPAHCRRPSLRNEFAGEFFSQKLMLS